MSAKPLYGASTAVTVTINGLVNGGFANSAEYNNTVDLALAKLIEVVLAGSNVAESGAVYVYARQGIATGVLETDENLKPIGIVHLNGTTAVRSVLRYDNPAPFFQLAFKHVSSGAYSLGAAGNSANILSENIQDV